MPFRFPSDDEIDDALATVAQLGGQVVRMYALSVRKADDPADMPRHILGPGKFNEEAFVDPRPGDRGGAQAQGPPDHPPGRPVELVGGTAELAGFRGKSRQGVLDRSAGDQGLQLIAGSCINRVNTVTGVPYRDDRAILAWETGNELASPDAWIKQAAAIIKGLDQNHLVIDGAQRHADPGVSLEDPNIDFVQTHHYEKDPRADDRPDPPERGAGPGQEAVPRRRVRLPAHRVAHGRDRYRHGQGLTGAMLWSIRYHNRDGGLLLAPRARRRRPLQGVPLAGLRHRRGL